MPTIAQKLCHDIVEPILKPPFTDDTSKRKLCAKPENSFTNRQSYSRSSPSVKIEKKRIITKIEPGQFKNDGSKLKTKEIIKKVFVDSGNNTLISGPLRCDNKCVTNVRTRDHESNCKCRLRKISFKLSEKKIQTCNFNGCSDKACTQSIKTGNRSTQYFDNHISKSKLDRNTYNFVPICKEKQLKATCHSSKYSKTSDKETQMKDTIIAPHVLYKNTLNTKPIMSNSCKPLKLKYNNKRWAISKHPIMGPDF